jgi:hypothetical protein
MRFTKLVASKCWDGGNIGHQEQMADAWAKVGTCTGLMQ